MKERKMLSGQQQNISPVKSKFCVILHQHYIEVSFLFWAFSQFGKIIFFQYTFFESNNFSQIDLLWKRFLKKLLPYFLVGIGLLLS